MFSRFYKALKKVDNLQIKHGEIIAEYDKLSWKMFYCNDKHLKK